MEEKGKEKSHFKEMEIPQQRHYQSFTLPIVVSPNPITTCPPNNDNSLSHLVDSIRTEKPYLESLLHKSGAILLRGFPIKTASDFNDVVEAFGYEDFPYIGGAALRTQVFGRVYTANESPLHHNIGFHSEMSPFPKFPSKLFFFCEVEPIDGGETPLVPSHIAYERVKERHPDFVQQLEEHGITYSMEIGEEDDPSNPVGRGWQSQFATNDKKVAEQRASNVGLNLKWLKNGAKLTTGPTPGILYDKSRSRKVWFNSFGVRPPEDGRNDKDAQLFGNGEPLPSDIVSDCLSILEEESVAFSWQKGDLLLIDNLAVLHGRRPCNPPRRVLASLCK